MDQREPQMTEAQQMKEWLFEAIFMDTIDIEGGPLDGKTVIELDSVRSAFEAAPLPEPTEHAASVRTPATIQLALICPNCGESAPSSVRLSSSLTIEGDKRTLKSKASTASAEHICGQTRMMFGDEAGSEPAFDIDDIVPSGSDRGEPNESQEESD